jgi:multicomponent Na+:H+ antiporter subunit D
VLLGLLSVLLAVGVAGVALWAPRIPDLAKSALAPLHPVLTGLRRVHSGHIGDYVAWLFVGVAAFTALVGVPLM